MSRTKLAARAEVPKIDLDTMFGNQRGLATRRQLLAAGLDDEDIRRQLRATRWQRVLPGMYANNTGAVTLEQRRIAATLFTSPSAQVTGIAALTWLGFHHLPADPLIHVLVPHTLRRCSRGFLRIQRTLRLDPEPRQASGYLVCSAARAVSDACRGLSEIRSVRAIVAEAVQRSFTTIAVIEEELALAGTSRTALLRRAVREVGSGARSAPEVDLQDTLRPATLPRIVWNPRLEALDGTPLPSPDGWIDDVGIALEVDSREYHLSPEDWQRTMRRHNLLASYGALVLHFTPSEISGRRRSVRGVVERTYQERAASGATAAIRLVSVPNAQEGSPPPG